MKLDLLFKKNIHNDLNHIIRYINNFKKNESYKDYYFQVFFLKNKENIKKEIQLIFYFYNEYLKTTLPDNSEFKNCLPQISFSEFLTNKNINININLNETLCEIINFSFVSKKTHIEQNKFEVKHLQQKNTIFESVPLKNTFKSMEGFQIIKNELNQLNLNFNLNSHFLKK